MVKRTAVLVGGAFLLSACIGGDDRAGGPAVRDSAGIAIVENPADAGEDLPWRLEASPTLELGRADGDRPDVFGSIRHVIRLRTGAIAVADAMAREIRIFDEAGLHVSTVGGEGEGPGEFTSLWWIAELGGDSIAAVDNLNARISMFDGDGEFARAFQVPRPDGAAAPNIVGFLGDGEAVFHARTAPPSQDAGKTSTVLVFTVRDGEVSAEVGEFVDRKLGANGLGLGFGGQAVLAVADSLIWYAHTSRFEFRVVDRDGSVLRIVRVNRTPRPVTEEDMAQARARVEESLARQGATAATARRIMETEFADTHPVHGQMLVDALRYLWVAGSRRSLLDSDHPEERQERWDVFDPDGRLLGRVTTPDGFRVAQIGEAFVLGVHTDALGVERVRLYRLERG